MGILLMLIGGGLLIGSLAGSIAVYVNDRERRDGKGRSIILFATGALLAGISGIFIFIYALSPLILSMFSGEERGWIGAIIGVPAFFGAGVATFLYFWIRRGTP